MTDRPEAQETFADYPNVRRPIRMRDVRIPNRIVRTACGTGLATGAVTPRLIDYHVARGRGGVGLTILGDGRIHERGTGLLDLRREEIIAGYAELNAACHQTGMVLFQELTHQGAAAVTTDERWAPSPIESPIDGRPATPMTQSMIDDVTEGFVVSALNCQRANLAGVEVHAAHGFLIGQFLSPLTNQRTDEFGGSLLNRARILRQVLEAIRQAVGPQFVIGIRLSVTDGVPGGIDIEESQELISDLEKQELVDFLDLSVGSIETYDQIIGSLDLSNGYQLPATTQVARGTSLPTMVAGRINSLTQAERVIAAGDADMVSIVRATIADANLVAISLAGRDSSVRPCIGCNECVAIMVTEKRLFCSVNPDIGVESRVVLRPQKTRNVLVVGGGPAGMECAVRAATRGHQVTLVERRDLLGGALELASRAPHRGDLGLFVQWQTRELAARGVAVELGCEVTPALVEDRQPDVIVIATGSVPLRDGIQRSRPGHRPTGMDLEHVSDVYEVLQGRRPRGGGPIVVLDDLGSNTAVAAIEILAQEGYPVTVVTPYPELCSMLGPTLQKRLVTERFLDLGIRLAGQSLLEAVEDDHVVVTDILGSSVRMEPADFVVTVTGFGPSTNLTSHLEQMEGQNVTVIGDAQGPATLRSAVSSGALLGESI